MGNKQFDEWGKRHYFVKSISLTAYNQIISNLVVSDMLNMYRGPSIDASYQVSDQLALWFQRRRLKCEKLTDDGPISLTAYNQIISNLVVSDMLNM
jgi:hypothetical protein